MRPKKAHPRRSGPASAALALQWLVQDTHGASVLATAQNLMQAEQVIHKLLPPVLAYGTRVARIDRQCITLAVPAAAHATRLRQLTPRLLQALTEHGWNLNRVEIRVQAGLLAQTKVSVPRETQALDRQALNCFEQLSRNVAPGPLADAIDRLLMHHGATTAPNQRRPGQTRAATVKTGPGKRKVDQE